MRLALAIIQDVEKKLAAPMAPELPSDGRRIGAVSAICPRMIQIRLYADMNWELPPSSIATTKLDERVTRLLRTHRQHRSPLDEHNWCGEPGGWGNRNLSSPRLAEEFRRLTYRSLA
jgi:hypothetical protein